MSDQGTTPADAGATTTDTAGTLARDADGILDIDKLAPEPEPVNEDEKPDAEAEKVKAEAETAKQADEEKKRLSGAQRSKLQRQALLDQIAERDRKIAELSKKEPAADAGPKAPEEKDFNGDWFAYRDALSEYKSSEAARKTTQDVLKSSEERRSNERAAQAARDLDNAHLERVEKAKEVIADFDAVMEKMKGVHVHGPNTLYEIKSSDKSDLISYHFATNPTDLDAFDAMTPREQAREIGRLEATLKMPEPKKQTSAPPPLQSLKGGASPRDQSAELNAWLDKKYGKDRLK